MELHFSELCGKVLDVSRDLQFGHPESLDI